MAGAGDAIIGALRVVLGLDSASFEDGLKSSENKATGFQKAFSGVSAGVVAAGTLIANSISSVASSIVSSMGAAIDKLVTIGKTALRAGTDVESFAAIGGVAKNVGVDIDTLGQGMVRLSRNIADVAQGKSSEAKKAFDVLGISVRDSSGQVKDSSTVFAELANKFKDYTEGANEVALATALMGRGGSALLPVLNEGSKAITEQKDQMKALGLEINANTVAAALKTQKEFDKLNKIWDGIVLQLTAGMLPALQDVSGSLLQVAKDAKGMEDTQNVLNSVIRFGTDELLRFSLGVQRAGVELIGLKEAGKLIFSGEFSKAWELLKKNGEDTDAAFAALNARLAKTPPPETEKGLVDMNEVLSVVQQNLDAINRVKISAPAIPLGDLSKTLNELTIKTAELRGEFNNLAPGFVQQAIQLGLVDQLALKLTNDQTKLTAAQQALNQALLQQAGAQLVEQSLPAYLQYEQQLQRIQVLLSNNAITADQAALASRKAAESTGQAWDIAAGKIASDLATGLAAAAQANKEFSTAAKIAAIAQAVFNTYTAATKALATYPPPFSYAAAAASVVAGLGYVAKIQSQQFATGGSFKVGGGLTGVDSQMVAFQATPGEMVDIRRPGQVGGSGGGSQTVEIRGMKPGDLFTGDMLRGLFDSLNAGMSDGYKLKVPA